MKTFFLKWVSVIGLISYLLLVIVIINYNLFKKPILINSSNTILPPLKYTIVLPLINIEPEKTIINIPLRLKIPIINIDTEIESKKLTPTGTMDVADNIQNVSWFSLGTIPGNIGSAVIAGHLDGIDGKKAIFFNLNKLLKGDKIYIEDIEGKTISFTVQGSKLYDKDADVPEVFFSRSGAHLNLITCDGSWNESKQIYNKRLVIFSNITE